MKLSGIKNSIISGYAKKNVFIKLISKIIKDTTQNIIVFIKWDLYSPNSLDNIIVISLSEITINKIIKILSVIFIFNRLYW